MIEVWCSDEYDFDETEYLKDYQQYLEEIRTSDSCSYQSLSCDDCEVDSTYVVIVTA